MGGYLADTGIASRRNHPCTVCFWNQGTKPLYGYLKAVLLEFVGQVFGWILAQLVHKTPLDRRGSACSAGCTKNQLVAQPDCLQAPSFIFFVHLVLCAHGPVLILLMYEVQ